MEWRDVVGWEDQYMVSNDGQVYAKGREFVRVDGRQRTVVREKILKAGVNKHGYRRVIFSKPPCRHLAKLVHRLVAEAFIPNPDNKPQVNHKDGNKLNNSVDNLEWCTNEENVKHAWASGFHKNTLTTLKKNFCENHPGAILRNEEVIEIFFSREKARILADRFGVKVGTIHGIRQGRSWSKLTRGLK